MDWNPAPTAAVITEAAIVRDFTTNASRKVQPGPCYCSEVLEMRGRKVRLVRLPDETRHGYIAASKVKETN